MSKKRVLLVSLLLAMLIITPVGIFLLSNTARKPSEIIPLQTPTPFQTNTIPQSISQPIIPAAPLIESNDLGVVTFTMKDIPLPSEANIYSVTHYGIDENYAKQIAASFFFIDSPDVSTDVSGKTLRWKNDDNTKHLTIYLSSGQIEYANFSTPGKLDPDVTQSPSFISSKEEAISIAQAFLVSKNIVIQNTKVKDVLLYAGNSESSQIQNFSEATVYEVSFIHSIDGLTTYYPYGKTTQISVFIDKSKKIIKLVILQLNTMGNSEKRSLISFIEAQNKLKEGKGIIVKYGTDENVYDAKLPIQSTLLNNVSLNYFDDQKGIIQPIFVFSGKATSNDGIQRDILIYLPAIKN